MAKAQPTTVHYGQRFGRLRITQPAGVVRVHDKVQVTCDCGTTKSVTLISMQQGLTRSCGCLHRETAAAVGRRGTKHGHKTTAGASAEYNTWQSMLARCRNPASKDFDRYGGRGIMVCERWESFENFLADMGPRPSPKHTLDRFPKQDGNYEPDNCRWATATEQARNRRNNRLLDYRGRTAPMVELAEACGIRPGTVQLRLRRGWTVAEALETPPGAVPPRQRVDAVVLTHNGITAPIKEWANRVGLPLDTLRGRLRRGWDVARALDASTSTYAPKAPKQKASR